MMELKIIFAKSKNSKNVLEAIVREGEFCRKLNVKIEIIKGKNATTKLLEYSVKTTWRNGEKVTLEKLLGKEKDIEGALTLVAVWSNLQFNPITAHAVLNPEYFENIKILVNIDGRQFERKYCELWEKYQSKIKSQSRQ